MKSWIASANARDCDFPIQNLPFGVFNRAGGAPVCATAVGEFVLDLSVLEDLGLLVAEDGEAVFSETSLNRFMGLGPGAWSDVREQLTDLLKEGGKDALSGDQGLQDRALVPMADAVMHMPFTVSEYTDFYAGRQHAFNVGSMFRDPENALPPNWLHIPIGYNGRASTVVPSGTDFHRPMGQLKPPTVDLPSFEPCKRLDIELEMGAVVGTPSTFGRPITVTEADEMIFGYVLLNDWSARDIQTWEYQPLGPFQAKAFATTISPWVITKAALEPFRTSAPPRDKEMLPYLKDPGPLHYDIQLAVSMQPAGGGQATTIARTNAQNLYYSAAQQLAHHASSGCKMNTGDLLGSGTISGDDASAYGSLLEMTWNGKNPLTLDCGAERTFIEDGDTLSLHGWADHGDYRIGFGPCTGTILPATDQPDW